MRGLRSPLAASPLRRVLWTLVAVAIGAAFLYFRLNYQTRLLNGDDWIVLGVAEGMAQRGDLNTNWAVNPVPKEFKYPQYNFSSYNLLAHAVLSAAPENLPRIPVLRAANLVFQGLAAVLLALALRNARAPAWGVAAGTALFVVAPGVVHDAHMLRTESLLYLLFAIVIWSATSPRALVLRVSVAGLAIGFGTASKVTFLASGLVMAPLVLLTLRERPRTTLLLLTAAGACCALGFVIGAPYAIVQPDAFLEGLRVLREQYAGGHLPHSRADYDPLQQAWWIASFFAVLYGPFILASLAAPLLARPPAWVMGLWLSSGVSFAWFVSQQVFFERNFSLAILAAATLIGWLAASRPRIAGTIAIVSAAPMLWWSQQILEETLDHHLRRSQWEEARGLDVSHYAYGFLLPPPDTFQCRGVVGLIDHNDDTTPEVVAALAARGERLVARYEGRFHLAPTSTLHSFLDSDVIYYACRTPGV